MRTDLTGGRAALSWGVPGARRRLRLRIALRCAVFSFSLCTFCSCACSTLPAVHGPLRSCLTHLFGFPLTHHLSLKPSPAPCLWVRCLSLEPVAPLTSSVTEVAPRGILIAHLCVCLPHDLRDFSASALLTFGAGSFFVEGPALCIIGCLAASPASAHRMPVITPLPSCDSQKCLQ